MTAARPTSHAATCAALEEDVAAARARHARFEETLERLRARRELTRGLLRSSEPASRLSLVPVLAAVVAALSSLAAALCAWATLVGATAGWTTGGLAAAVAALISCSLVRVPGAGGATRRALGRFSFVVTLFAALFLILGASVAHHVR